MAKPAIPDKTRQRIIQLRAAHPDLTYAALARRMGISDSSVFKILKARKAGK